MRRRCITAQVVGVVRSAIVVGPVRVPRASLVARAAVLADPEEDRAVLRDADGVREPEDRLGLESEQRLEVEAAWR